MKDDGFLIGIDIGSTNIKCIAANPDGREIFSAKASNDGAYRTVQHSAGRGRHLDGDRLWRIISMLCSNVMSDIRNEFPHHPILGIGTASLGCLPFLLDKNGRQLFPLNFSGNCLLYERTIKSLTPSEYFAVTGYPLEPGNAVFRIASALEADPALSSQICAVLSVADYINYRLTGEIAREFSTSCSIGMWDIRKRAWAGDLLSGLGLDESVFGFPVESGVAIGKVHSAARENTGFPEGTPVCTGGHDYLCVSYSVGCLGPGKIINALGTYEIVASIHDEPPNKPEFAVKRCITDCHVYPGKYSLMTEDACAVQTEWLKKIVASCESGTKADEYWDGIFRRIDGMPGRFRGGIHRELFIPRVYPQLFPGINPELTGGYFGITSATSPESLLLATIEGLCFSSKQMFEYQKEILSNDNPQIVVVGGGSRSKRWLQTKADILGMTLTVPQIREATALGAALLAGVGSGTYSSHAEAAAIAASCPTEAYEPDNERKQLYSEVYRKAYLPLCRYLSGLDKEMSMPGHTL